MGPIVALVPACACVAAAWSLHVLRRRRAAQAAAERRAALARIVEARVAELSELVVEQSLLRIEGGEEPDIW